MTFPAVRARSLRPTPGGALLLVTLVAAAGPARYCRASFYQP